jgi:hypothetical protein
LVISKKNHLPLSKLIKDEAALKVRYFLYLIKNNVQKESLGKNYEKVFKLIGLRIGQVPI